VLGEQRAVSIQELDGHGVGGRRGCLSLPYQRDGQRGAAAQWPFLDGEAVERAHAREAHTGTARRSRRSHDVVGGFDGIFGHRHRPMTGDVRGQGRPASGLRRHDYLSPVEHGA